ncbi:MAG: UDP-3-O-acyl-N-acetylglucosamine deacetylase [Deltaproteobacteria bacterium]|nr:UDP-3-O-acyl-N-acetylglucosamine deacetylase [Deltaproteobacteria bacterium]MBW2382155.1 UDP-3-O-acyl-N-acetylglucosamine deacetylase [Deltaproteobacteria bacterium]MBW2696277.1 UDP-3-O-acyl-N-acetylglucosamine deacetylase [Deltaproteobacteria bacterium]
MLQPRCQRTIAEKVSCSGVGLHGGHAVQITLRPERPGRGIVFQRRFAGELIEIPAHAECVVSTDHATSIAVGDARIATVEHLLASLYAMQIDNVVVEVDGDELPVLDGSARGFVDLIDEAGAYEQDAVCDVHAVCEPIEIVEGNRRIRIDPAPVLRISYAIDFDHSSIGRQTFEIEALDRAAFERDVAAARTFGFLEDVEALWRVGLARGGSLANTLVLDAEGVVNEEGLRFPDEFVRHKVLDLIGDLALLGMPLCGHVSVERGGHALHQRLVRRLRLEAAG